MPTDLLDAVAAHGLGHCQPLADAPLADHAWSRLLGDVQQARLEGVLAAAVEDKALPVTDPQHEALTDVHASAMSRCLHLDARLLEVVDVLAAAGVEVRVLKGAAVAHLDHPDPSQRVYGDLDLLVRGADLSSAVTALARLGGRRDLPERRPGFDARFAKDVTVALPDGTEVDLHRTLALGAFGLRIPLASLWERSTPFELGGSTLHGLETECRLLHACFTAVLGDPTPRLVALRDLALLAGSIGGDDRRLAERSAAWRAQAVVAAAAAHTSERLDARPPALRGRETAEDRNLLRAYRTMGGSNTTELLSGVLGPERWKDRLAYIAAVLVPGPEYRAARASAGRPDEWRNGLRELLRRSR